MAIINECRDEDEIYALIRSIHRPGANDERPADGKQFRGEEKGADPAQCTWNFITHGTHFVTEIIARSI